MLQKHFEVKNGQNKGFYIVTEAKHLMDDTEFNHLANKWGMLPYEYSSGFYKFHGINPNTEVIWTHSRFAGHEYNRKQYESILKSLDCSNYNENNNNIRVSSI